jgi:hypothetical protein
MARPVRDLATTDGDWAVQAADTIENVVGTIRDKTTVPLTTAARAIVYGLLAMFAGATALVLFAIALVRLIDVVTGEGNVWIAHLIVGMVFVIPGFILWRKRTPKKG